MLWQCGEKGNCIAEKIEIQNNMALKYSKLEKPMHEKNILRESECISKEINVEDKDQVQLLILKQKIQPITDKFIQIYNVYTDI